jgi:ABC-2 type transport system ATP-binding protein
VKATRPTEPSAVSVEKLTVRRGQRVVVRDVAFEVAPGEVVGIVGKRHAGTSTILRAALGLLPSTGRVRILGRPYAQLADPATAVGVFLGPDGNPDERVRDHVRIAAALLGVGSDGVDAVLRDADLEDQAGVRRRRLTVSARQRLGIAMARMADPKVVVLDDPATGLDPEGVRWLRSTVRGLAEEGRAVLVACHPLSEMADELDRAVGIADGTVVADASPEELRDSAGKEVVARSPDAEALAARLRELGAARASVSGDEVRASDVSAAAVTTAAAREHIPVLEARTETPDLERALDLAAEDAPDGGAGGDGDPAGDAADGPAQGSGTTDGRAGDDPEDDAELGALESALDGELEGLPGPGAGTGRLVAVAAPVRGGGATTLTTLVADALAGSTERRVVAVALSVDVGRLSRPAPAARRSRLGVVDLARDASEQDDRFAVDPYVAVAPSGVHLVQGPPDEEALAALDAEGTRALLDVLRAAYDVVVVDLGARLPEAAAAVVAELADDVVLVGTPDVGDALEDPSPIVEVFERVRDRPAILALNRAATAQARAFARERPADRGVVPEDPELVRALDRADWSLAEADRTTRLALKHLALVVAGAAR